MEESSNGSDDVVPLGHVSTEGRFDPIFIEDSQDYNLRDFVIPNHYAGTLENILIPSGLVLDRIKKLAKDIRNDYSDKTIHLICVLKGGNAFFQDLITTLRHYHEYNDNCYIPFTYDFIKVKSYEGMESGDTVTITGGDLPFLKDKHVLIVEDIIDTGKTIALLYPKICSYGPKSVKIASLLEKRTNKSNGLKAHFAGFSIPDKFVVGYCLDYNEAYRDLLHICTINEAGIEKFKNFS